MAQCISCSADNGTVSRSNTTSGVQLLCRSCRQRVKRCNCCGVYLLLPEDTVLADGVEVCTGCSNTLTCCDSCGMKSARLRAAYNEQGDRILLCSGCRGEMNECSICGSFTHNTDGMGDLYVTCEACNDEYNICEYCDEVVHKERSFTYEGKSYCVSCFEDRRDCKLWNYSYKPEWKTLYDNGETIASDLLGIEIEVESKLEHRVLAQLDIYNKLGDCSICKRDSSIDECNGIEIVTHPMSYKYFYNRFADRASKLGKTCKGWTAKNAGMHIHMSRSSFSSKFHLAKFLLFFAKNRALVEIIAQRGTNRHWNHETPGGICYTKAVHGNQSRYEAVNLQNPDTVEIRIFKSTLNKKSMIKNIQFVLAVKEFSKKHSLKSLTETRFIEYVRKTDYTELINFINN